MSLSFPCRMLCLLVLMVPAVAGAADGSSKPVDDGSSARRELAEADFVNVNCLPDTWTWDDGTVRCSGNPMGVIKMRIREPAN